MPGRWSCKPLTLRSMGARRRRKSRVLAKKFAGFRFRAKALPSWASFPFPNRLGIAAKKTEKWAVLTEPFVHHWED
jgi:hypothetical protein